MLERLLDRAAVAHSVIDDRDQRRQSAGSCKRALGARHAVLARVQSDREPQRSCQRLERRLDHVVRVRPGLDRQVQRQLARSSPAPGRTPPRARGRSCRSRPAEATLRTRTGRAPRCRSRTTLGPRPSAPSPRRSARSRHGHRARGRTPGRCRSRRPRPCGARRSEDRHWRRTSRSKWPWRANRSSMWSRKPTPVSRSPEAVPSSPRVTWISVSAVLRSISAVRVIGCHCRECAPPSTGRGARIPRRARPAPPRGRAPCRPRSGPR